MATIDNRFGSGHANLAPGGSQGLPTLATTLQEVADDLEELRTQFIALLTKLDTDFTAQNIAVVSSQLDEDYESALTPAALLTIRGV